MAGRFVFYLMQLGTGVVIGGNWNLGHFGIIICYRDFSAGRVDFLGGQRSFAGG